MGNIETENIAPTFETASIFGEKIKLPNKRKWVFISFHRFSACPLCNLRTHELIKSYQEFKDNNIEIYSIWPSTEDSMKEYVGKSDAPFPLIADPKMKLFKLYNVVHTSNIPMKGIFKEPQIWMRAMKYSLKKIKIDGDGKLQPAGFLINPDGMVKIAYYGQHFGDHINIDVIIEQVRR